MRTARNVAFVIAFVFFGVFWYAPTVFAWYYDIYTCPGSQHAEAFFYSYMGNNDCYSVCADLCPMCYDEAMDYVDVCEMEWPDETLWYVDCACEAGK